MGIAYSDCQARQNINGVWMSNTIRVHDMFLSESMTFIGLEEIAVGTTVIVCGGWWESCGRSRVQRALHRLSLKMNLPICKKKQGYFKARF